MDIKNVSLVEDALARVLLKASSHAGCENQYECESHLSVSQRKEIVYRDEWLLRQALFGPEGYFQNGKAVAGHSAS